MLENPLRRLQQERRLSNKELADCLGVCADEVRTHVTGRFDRMRPKMIRALNAAGFDGTAMAAEYQAWIQARAAANRHRLHATANTTAVA